VSRFPALLAIAVRELFISFRLLLVLALLLVAGLPVALLPHAVTPGLAGAPPDALEWFGLGLAMALSLVAGIAAATLATERMRGSAGWMVVRAVPRATILLAWFCAFAMLLVIGLAPVGLLAWLALGAAVMPEGPMPLVAALVSAACSGLAAVALAFLVGSLLPPWPALVLTAVPVAAVLLRAAAGEGGWWTIPAGGLDILAQLDMAQRPVADALRAGGAALGVAAVTFFLAAAAFERADL
jgi:hypothetical protein